MSLAIIVNKILMINIQLVASKLQDLHRPLIYQKFIIYLNLSFLVTEC